jgi:threonine dehydrogenase-like Zn-dependent dehydrogenase
MVIEDVSGPGPARAGNVIVRPEAVGICGSDFHLFSGDVAALSGARDFYPRIQGHEVSAIVEDPGTAPLRPGAFPEKEIDVIGSSCATADDFRAAITLVTESQKSLAALFSHHFPLTRAGEAFEFAMKRPPDAIKIVVTVN